MADIILKSNAPAEAADFLKDVLAIEASRLKYSLNERLAVLENIENVASISE